LLNALAGAADAMLDDLDQRLAEIPGSSGLIMPGASK
jgi:hypothetical protein